MGETAKCIYCLKEKPVEDFNIEHVISRMLGRYNNAPTLNNHEVCEECNSYFCNEIESKLSSDSLEGLLRLRYHHAKAKDTGRNVGRTRLTITGKNDVFNGLQFTPSMNGSIPEGIQLYAESAIGIQLDSGDGIVDYYTLESLPNSSKLTKDGVPVKVKQIIVIGYSREDAEKALIEKGFDLSHATYTDNLSFPEITTEQHVEVDIKAKVDSRVHRLALKNILNFACYTLGKEYVMKQSLTGLRNYVRYGIQSKSLLSVISEKSVSVPYDIAPNSHIIGIGITALHDGFYIMGFVSWFGAITYSFILEKADKASINTDHYKCVVCDNEKREIKELPNWVVIDWPQSGCHVKITDEGNLMIVPVE